MVQMAVLFCKGKFKAGGGGLGGVSECQTKSSLREKKIYPKLFIVSVPETRKVAFPIKTVKSSPYSYLQAAFSLGRLS